MGENFIYFGIVWGFFFMVLYKIIFIKFGFFCDYIIYILLNKLVYKKGLYM